MARDTLCRVCVEHGALSSDVQKENQFFPHRYMGSPYIFLSIPLLLGPALQARIEGRLAEFGRNHRDGATIGGIVLIFVGKLIDRGKEFLDDLVIVGAHHYPAVIALNSSPSQVSMILSVSVFLPVRSRCTSSRAS